MSSTTSTSLLACDTDTTSTGLPSVYGYVMTFNGKRFLERCFRTLQQRTDYESFRLILVDNGSSDGSGDFVRKNFPDVEVMRIFPNVGYAGAANEAVADARRRGARYIALLNDDIAILQPQWLREAVWHAERDPSIGIIAFVDSDSADGPHPAPESKLTDVAFINSAVYVMPVELFDRIGMFDTVYFSNGEEDDLGARTQAAGYRVVVLGFHIYHFGCVKNQVYTLRTAYVLMRNGIRFCIKNRSPLHALLRTMRIIDVACNPWPLTFDKQNGAHHRMRNSGNVAVNLLLWLRAVLWNFVQLPQTLRIRAADRRLIRAARASRKGAAAAKPSRVDGTPRGQLT
jgi:GT2 family glycosyltransferase